MFNFLIFLSIILLLAITAINATPAHAYSYTTTTGNAIVGKAKSLAADAKIGYSYSYGKSGHEHDVICFSFVNKVLSSATSYSKPANTNFADQQAALKKLGFTYHRFTNFNDPDLIPGSIMYDSQKPLSTGHVEIYAGRYSTTKTDKYGNPVADFYGQDVSIGAKGWDRTTTALKYNFKAKGFDICAKKSPAVKKGDQYQPNAGNWWVGEVSGGRADSCLRVSSSGRNTSWACYYAPPKDRFSSIPNPTTQTYSGTKKRPFSQINVKVNGGERRTLYENQDYIVNYTNNVNAGTAIAVFTGINQYSGTKLTKKFQIAPLNLSSVATYGLNGRLDYRYTGRSIKPAPAAIFILNSNMKLVLGTDYSLSYVNNIRPGLATIYAHGKGNFTGTASGIFGIVRN